VSVCVCEFQSYTINSTQPCCDVIEYVTSCRSGSSSYIHKSACICVCRQQLKKKKEGKVKPPKRLVPLTSNSCSPVLLSRSFHFILSLSLFLYFSRFLWWFHTCLQLHVVVYTHLLFAPIFFFYLLPLLVAIANHKMCFLLMRMS